MIIQRLSELTIGQIAAGEVIERPAAVVKELIENAIDAGAGRIDVSIQGGGTELIEVRDDGIGIAVDDLPLAFERHATSKLNTLDDLQRLRTLGFRGEALASVAAVADVLIRTIQTDAQSGGEIRASYGLVKEPRRSAWGAGTAMSVKGLFANVPARREFLRTPATETAYITRITSAYALAYADIAFSLEIDGRRSFTTDGSGDRISAALSVWGREVAEALVTLQPEPHEHDGFAVDGVVSLPTLDRARRQLQFFFVQGRLVESRQLSVAFEQAYHTLLMVGRHPIGCILVEAPPDRIDVNVHPTKSEVRFADDRLVFALVQRAVRATLLLHTQHQTIPTVMESPLHRTEGGSGWTDSAVQRRMTLADPRRLPSRPAPAEEFEREHSAIPQSAGGRSLPVLRVLGQVSGMFITAEGPDGLYLIDQHAAHERIMFERVMAEFTSREPARQTLLEPVTVELSPAQHGMFEQCQDELHGLGFEVQDFGGMSVAVRAVPAMLRERDPSRALLTILDEMIDGGRGDSRLESLAISTACHASIRAGQPLSLLEMRELVTQLEACSSPQACGHGRPTMVKLTADELEKQFSRR